MGREIKFRYYSAPQGKMVEWGDIMKLHVHTVFKMLQPECVLMQYTGLKDKSGKELYDGDIYSQWGEVCKCDFEQTIYEKMNCLIFEGDFEIIGNIYENSELLKANK